MFEFIFPVFFIIAIISCIFNFIYKMNVYNYVKDKRNNTK